jgi:hypothetical protein
MYGSALGNFARLMSGAINPRLRDLKRRFHAALRANHMDDVKRLLDEGGDWLAQSRDEHYRGGYGCQQGA